METAFSIDYHVIDNCNLACDFCSHYSNFARPKSIYTIEQATEEWEKWRPYIQPSRLHLLGGEPTLHPDLEQMAKKAHQVWDKSEIWIYTNGTYLDRHPNLHHYVHGIVLMKHYKDMGSILDQCNRFNIADVRESSQWFRFYNLVNGKPTPFRDEDKRASWANCIAKECVVLRNSKLWKCPQVAFHMDAKIDWPEFNNYVALDNPEGLSEWLKKEDEECCSCCPANPKQYHKPLVQLGIGNPKIT